MPQCLTGNKFGRRTRASSNPCRGCDARHFGCHGNCKKYISWKEKHDALREKDQQLKKNGYRRPYPRSL
jgi:hypothetical protein